MQLPDFLSINDDGEVIFTGHRIRLVDIAVRYNEGHSAESIALEIFPTLKLATVHKAIAFYLENQAEVDSLIEENQRELQRQASQVAGTPSLPQLRGRMAARRTAEAS
ncbi:MAG TPA: DUF433 domain-containing protein [Tepidisphaeraceae bacterium]|nr:DUF433 domain-containing protein [Tepidisphaeraceae bacterium]